MMMETIAMIFWFSAGLVFYTYIGYPLLLALAAMLRGKKGWRQEPYHGSVSFVLAAFNEENAILRRLDELTGHLSRAAIPGEIIVVSDGSTDRTAALASDHSGGQVRVLALPDRMGKAAALTEGCTAARNEILVFADARQRWSENALPLLLENFADARVGAVSGELIIETAPGVMAGVGLYWRYEKWLRRNESRLHSLVGVTGAISAVRRELFQPVPPGTLLDDVYWPLCVAMQGYRVVHDRRAEAFDRLPDLARNEFRRKVRTLGGNYQLLGRLPSALLPWRNPVWLQYVSHKLLRLLAPWALLVMLVASFLLADDFYQVAFWAQIAGFGLGMAGMFGALARRSRLLSAAGSFLLLNAAAWCAFWLWLAGRSQRMWKKVVYSPDALAYPAPGRSQEAKVAT